MCACDVSVTKRVRFFIFELVILTHNGKAELNLLLLDYKIYFNAADYRFVLRGVLLLFICLFVFSHSSLFLDLSI